MNKLTRAILATALTTVGTCAVLAPAASAAPESTLDLFAGAAYSTTGKTVTAFTERPGHFTTYLVQTGDNGEEFAYSATVEAPSPDDGSSTSSADIELRWTLCSHPATITIVERRLVGFDEFDQPIYSYVTTYTDPHWTGGFFVSYTDEGGRQLIPACGRDRKEYG